MGFCEDTLRVMGVFMLAESAEGSFRTRKVRKCYY